MVKISANRLDMETRRLERAQIRNYTETLVTVTATASTTLDVSLGNVFAIAQAVSITTLTISNIPASGSVCSITLVITHDATANSYTFAWPAAFKWSGASVPTLTQTANAVDIITAMTRDGGVTWFAFAGGLNMS